MGKPTGDSVERQRSGKVAFGRAVTSGKRDKPDEARPPTGHAPQHSVHKRGAQASSMNSRARYGAPRRHRK